MTAKKNASENFVSRPTSPHLPIYRWSVSSLTSIMHRFTGILLYVSIVAISWYIVYYAYQINIADSSETCDCPMNAIINNIFALASVGTVFSLYYHFCNGIRHLFWDIGKGFDKNTAKTNGLLIIFLSIIFTSVTIGAVIYLKFY